MEPSVSSPTFPAYDESDQASEDPAEVGEGSGLALLLIILTPFALAAWFAIGLAVYRGVT